MRDYYVYILTNWSQTTLYTGVTNDLYRRVYEHKRRLIPGFTSTYHIDRLVHYETFPDIRDAIAREKEIKGWSRRKKDALIKRENRDWRDLTVDVLGIE